MDLVKWAWKILPCSEAFQVCMCSESQHPELCLINHSKFGLGISQINVESEYVCVCVWGGG
jgi:hypothetical protein